MSRAFQKSLSQSRASTKVRAKKLVSRAYASFWKAWLHWAELLKTSGSRAKIRAEPRLDPALTACRSVHRTECNFAENQYCFWILIWRWDSFVVKKTLRRAHKVIIIFLPRSSIKPAAPTLYIGMNNKDFPSKYSILDYSMLVTSVYNERRTPWSVKIERKKVLNRTS